MQEVEFLRRIESTLLSIEDQVEAQSESVDFDNEGGVLTLTLENDSKIIINGQSATRELWVAARSGGYHLAADVGGWVCRTTHERLGELLSRLLAEQGAGSLQFAGL